MEIFEQIEKNIDALVTGQADWTLGGLISCGFIINGYMECQREDITELMFMVKAHKG